MKFKRIILSHTEIGKRLKAELTQVFENLDFTNNPLSETTSSLFTKLAQQRDNAIPVSGEGGKKSREIEKQSIALANQELRDILLNPDAETKSQQLDIFLSDDQNRAAIIRQFQEAENTVIASVKKRLPNAKLTDYEIASKLLLDSFTTKKNPYYDKNNPYSDQPKTINMNYDEITEKFKEFFLNMPKKLIAGSKGMGPIHAFGNSCKLIINRKVRDIFAQKQKALRGDAQVEIDRQLNELKAYLAKTPGLTPEQVEQAITDKKTELYLNIDESSLDFQMGDEDEGGTVGELAQENIHGGGRTLSPPKAFAMKTKLQKAFNILLKKAVANYNNKADLGYLILNMRDLNIIKQQFFSYELGDPKNLELAEKFFSAVESKIEKAKQSGEFVDQYNEESMQSILTGGGEKEAISDGSRKPISLDDFVGILESMRGQTWETIPYLYKILSFGKGQIEGGLNEIPVNPALKDLLLAGYKEPESPKGKIALMVFRKLLDTINLADLSRIYGIQQEDDITGMLNNTITKLVKDEEAYDFFVTQTANAAASYPPELQQEIKNILTKFKPEQFRRFTNKVKIGIPLALAEHIRVMQYDDLPWSELDDDAIDDIVNSAMITYYDNYDRPIEGFSYSNDKGGINKESSRTLLDKKQQAEYLKGVLINRRKLETDGLPDSSIFPNMVKYEDQKPLILSIIRSKLGNDFANILINMNDNELMAFGMNEILPIYKTNFDQNDAAEMEQSFYPLLQQIVNELRNPVVKKTNPIKQKVKKTSPKGYEYGDGAEPSFSELFTPDEAEEPEEALAMVFKKLVRVANILDNSKFSEEANIIDNILETICKNKKM